MKLGSFRGPLSFLGLIAVTVAASGCAIRYYDRTNGAEHIWGLGHLVTRTAAANGGVRAVVNQIDILGVSLGVAADEHNITFGWDSRRRVEIADDTAICLRWPKGSLLDIRVGSEWPDAVTTDSTKGVRACRPN